MSVTVETVPGQSFTAEQIVQIVNQALVSGQYGIKQVSLAFQDRYPPVKVAALERRDSVASDGLYLITDLVTGARYDFIANASDDRVACESVGLSCLNPDTPTNRIAMLTFDELSCYLQYWNSPEEEPALDIGGTLDPFMSSIVSRLRKKIKNN